MKTDKKSETSPLSIDNLLSGLGPAVLKSIRDPFSIISANYNVIWINRAMAWIYGIDHEEVIGKTCYESIFGRKMPCEDCVIQEVMKTGKTYITERWEDFPDGKRRYGEVRAYPVRDDVGNIAATIIIVIDITSKKEELAEQKDYSAMLVKKLSEKSTGEQPLLREQDITLTTSLSDRETEVLRLITEGYTNNQISGLLDISHHTVKSHVTGIFNKMGVNDRTQAAVIAFRNKLV